MGWSITIDPLLPWVLVMGLAALGAVIVGLMIAARSRGVWLRVLALGFLALCGTGVALTRGAGTFDPS